MFKFRLKSLFILAISFLLIFLASSYKGVTELVYTNFLNRILRENLSYLSWKLSIPIGDVLNIVLIVLIILIFMSVIRNLSNSDNILHSCYKLIWFVINMLAIVIFSYIFLYGLNYHTRPLQTVITKLYEEKYATTVNVNVDNGTMVNVFKNLEQKALDTKRLANSVNENYSINNLTNLSIQADKGFRLIADKFPMMYGNYSPAKVSLESGLMSYFGMDGRYYMLTNEVTINKNVPKIYLPFIVSKYMAYQRGAAKEDEASFYAFLACTSNTSPEFKYSGYIAALYNLLNTLRVYDKIDYNNIIETINPDLKKDINTIQKYVDTYGSGTVFKDRFMNSFKRINGDIRYEPTNYEFSILICTYYSVFSF